MSGDDKRIVRQDTGTGLCCIFKPLKRGLRKKLDATSVFGDAELNWRGADELSISDQSVWLAVIEVVQEQLNAARVGRAAPGDSLWNALCPEPNPFSNTAVTVTTSYSALARRCGWNTGGSSIQRVQEGLQRLAETTLWVIVAKLKGGTRLLAWELGDDKQVRLAVNWRLAKALQGEGQYARVSLTERLKLGDEIAKALHAWLSCQMNSLPVWRSGLDKLQRHVWGDIVVGVHGRVRRFKLRRALAAIGELPGWSIRVDGDMATFARDLQAKPRKAELVVTETTRRFEPKTLSSPKRRETTEASNHAALPVVSAADLFSKKDGVT